MKIAKPEDLKKALACNAGEEIEKIAGFIRKSAVELFRKRGGVVAISGGIDSSVVAALCAKAFGADNVLGLILPEKESSPTSQKLAVSLAEKIEIEYVVEDITAILEVEGCYRRRNNAIRAIIPEYDEGWKSKIVLPSVVDSDALRLFSVVAESPRGVVQKKRLDYDVYLEIVAASNFKQRTRKMIEYFHADRLNYLVAGTPNRLEFDQGFFVKGGDGLADLKPIAHLYKSQVFRLAEALEIPDAIRTRTPTTDTYSMPQGQDEFYFSLPYDRMDLCLLGKNMNVPEDIVADAAGLTAEQLKRVYRDIDQKRRSSGHLHLSSLLVEEIMMSEAS